MAAGDRKEASPVTHAIFGTPLPAKSRSVAVKQRTQPTITWPMLTDGGDPVDLTGFDTADYEVVLAMREALQESESAPVTAIGSIATVATGIVQATVPDAALAAPGISLAEIAVREVATGYIRFSNAFWLIVERSLFGASYNAKGPPTLAEIRLHLRDAPEGNRILDDYDFDPAEIALAATRCVDWFNEVEPPLDQRYSTANFPSRFHWMDGIVSELFTTAAHWFRRNKFQYSAGGLQVSSVDKEGEYMQAAQYHRQRWEDWARKAKVRANMAAGMVSWGSGYSGSYGGW